MGGKTLVLGIGNPIKSDDAVGLRVAQKIKELDLPGVTVEEESASGLEVIESIMDYEMVIVIDAILTGNVPAGTVMIYTPEDFRHVITPASPHEINIFTALELGRRMEPHRMPEELFLVAIEVKDVMNVSEEMSPEVERAVPEAVKVVLDLIAQKSSDS